MIKRLIDGIPLGLSILAFAGVLYLGYIETQREITRTLVIGPAGETELSDENEVTIAVDAAYLARLLSQIEDIEKDAGNAANSADAILGFIEGGFTLLGVLIAIATVVFGLGIQDLRSRLTQSIASADDRFEANEDQLEKVIADVNKQVENAIASAQASIRQSVERVATLTREFEGSKAGMENTIQDMHGVIHEALDEAKANAENSFRVLSLLLLAEQQVRARNRATAINTLEEAFALDPDNQTTNYLLGYLYVGRKDFNRAVEHLERALQISPDFAPALAALGLAQRRMGDGMNNPNEVMLRNQYWARAEYNLNRALLSDPALIDADNESYFGTLGGLYRRQHRYEDALRVYEDAVKITPNNSYPVTNLATLYKKLGREEQAQEMYQRAIEISLAILDDHPGDTWSRLDLAQSYLVMGQKAKAVKEYKDVIGRIREASPLETALSGLEFLADAPHPINGLGEAMEMLQQAIKNIAANPKPFSDHTL